MCRLTVYKGRPVLLGDIIVTPENSLVCQSRDAAYHPGVVDKSHIRNIRVNGDGFGVAFYGQSLETGACLFKFVTPAWSNKNLISISQFVYSNLIMGHIRAATSGIDPFEPQSVSIENCHPFKFGRWCLMHNGGIPRFSKIKLQLLNLLDAESFQFISGSTDSEHIFALFLTLLPDRNAQLDVKVITDTLETTISAILKLCEDAGIHEAASLNLVVSDGIHVVATRFRNGVDAPPSLYYSYGNKFLSSEGTFHEPGNDQSCEIVISSAPLCKDFYIEDGNDNIRADCGWILAPKNTMLVCEGDVKDRSKISNIFIQGISLKSARYLNKHLKIGEISFLSKFSILSTNTPISTSHKQTVFPSPNKVIDSSDNALMQPSVGVAENPADVAEGQSASSELKIQKSSFSAMEPLSTAQTEGGDDIPITHSIVKTIFTHKSSFCMDDSTRASSTSECQAESRLLSVCPITETEPFAFKTRHSLRSSRINCLSYDVKSKDSADFADSLGSPAATATAAATAAATAKLVPVMTQPSFSYYWAVFDVSWRLIVVLMLLYIIVRIEIRNLSFFSC